MVGVETGGNEWKDRIQCMSTCADSHLDLSSCTAQFDWMHVYNALFTLPLPALRHYNLDKDQARYGKESADG